MPIANTCSIGYPHDGRADNAAYRHDRRADNAAYRHDRRADSLSPLQHLFTEEVSKMAASEPKPLCKFGENCYRKNPQHLKQFRHPKRKQTEVLKWLCFNGFSLVQLLTQFCFVFLNVSVIGGFKLPVYFVNLISYLSKQVPML